MTATTTRRQTIVALAALTVTHALPSPTAAAADSTSPSRAELVQAIRANIAYLRAMPTTPDGPGWVAADGTDHLPIAQAFWRFVHAAREERAAALAELAALAA